MKSITYRHGLLIFAITVIIYSCEKDKNSSDRNDPENLPFDTGGIQFAHIYGETDAPYGFYIYLPSGYEKTKCNYPLLVFLHGAGEKGNSANDPEVLKLVLRNGPPKLIQQEKWDPPYPMVVVSPQCHENGWNAAKVHNLIKFIIEDYKINEERIYLTGLSMGGYGTYSYLQAYSDTGYVAAAVPICGAGNTSKADRLLNIPLWAFHGSDDKTVAPSGSINMVNAINELNPHIKAKLTIYPGIGHDSWTMTYNSSGMGKESPEYDPFEMTIYEWMFLYSKK